MSTQFYFPPWNATLSYAKYDVFYDTYQGTNLVYGYATQDNFNQDPNSSFVFPITQYSRSDDITTLTYTHTGTGPVFAAGSFIKVTGVNANTSVNYSGMVLAGGTGWVSYINPGWSQTASITTGAINCFNPCWTSGFLFIPGYSTKVDINNKAIVAKLGDSYEQREPQALNTYDKVWNMSLSNRTDRELKALINYVEDSAGVRPFTIVIPVSKFENQPNHKYVADTINFTSDSYNIDTANVVIRRVFDL